LGGIETVLYYKSSHIVTLLPFAQRYMAKRGVNPEKITYIPNGIDLDSFPAPKAPPDRPVFSIVYAGAHGLANGLDVILEAARLVQQAPSSRPIVFRLIGSGPEKARLQEIARQRKIENVQFEPARPKTEVYTALADADAFVVNLRNSPLYQYGISLNKIYEYLAAGRPTIIASNAANNPVAEAGAGEVVPADDATGIAHAAL